MKIAILTWNYLPKRAGGTEIATQSIARHLANRGHEVLVITTRDLGLPKETMGEGFRIYRVKPLNPKLLKYAFFCFKTFLILRRFRPDVIHAQAMWTGLPALIAKIVIGRPYVVWVRGSDVYFPRLFKGWLSRLILRNADTVIALTEDMKKELKKVYMRNIVVIGNGVDAEQFCNHSRKDIRQKLSLKEDEKVIIFVGTIAPIKGVIYLIEAMSLIKQKRPETRLLIVGDGEERYNLVMLVRKLNLEECTIFSGRIFHADVPKYLAASDVFVLPTLSEGFPNTIAEAMAAGLPIVSTRVRGLSEIVAEGNNGFLVEPRNPAQLAEKILLILHNDILRDEMSANNKTWAKQHTWEKVAERLEEVCSGIVKNKASV